MSKTFEKTRYQLKSIKTGKIFNDTGWLLDAPGEVEPTLIRAMYEKKQIEVKDDSWGLYKFADWLPVSKTLAGSSAPVTYKVKVWPKNSALTTFGLLLADIGPRKASTCKPALSRKQKLTPCAGA